MRREARLVRRKSRKNDVQQTHRARPSQACFTRSLVRSYGALDVMLAKRTCPWCKANLGFGVQLGSRPSTKGPRFHEFSWFRSARNIAVCPYCGKPVKSSRKSQRWLLLVFPVILLPLFELFTMDDKGRQTVPVPAFLYWIFVAVAVVGGVMTAVTTRFEKEDDI